MRFTWIALLASAGALAIAAETPSPAVPVMIELFTSEGCSDCPPADTLLAQLDERQPVAGAQIIVLSEHLDYWDRLGWKDPFSSPFFSHRQESYGHRFHLEGPYTPQMVVDGTAEFVGSDGRRALSAIGAAAKTQKASVRLSRVTGSKLRVEVDPAPVQETDIYIAVAENRTASQVLRGENHGRNLTHTAVVRRLESIGRWNGRMPFARDLAIPEVEMGKFRIVAFVQERNTGRITGAAMLSGR